MVLYLGLFICCTGEMKRVLEIRSLSAAYLSRFVCGGAKVFTKRWVNDRPVCQPSQSAQLR